MVAVVLCLSLLAQTDSPLPVIRGIDDNSIKIWDLKAGQVVQSLKGHLDQINSIAFSPNGQLLASGSADKTIKVWNLKTGQAVQTYIGHSGSVNSIVFTPDGKSIASGSQDGTIKIWQLAP